MQVRKVFKLAVALTVQLLSLSTFLSADAVAAENRLSPHVVAADKELICQLMKIDEDAAALALPSDKDVDKQAYPYIPCMTWIDAKVPLKAVIVCVHGCGLHKGSWHQFGERMAPLGYAIYAVDVRGFGSFAQEMPGKVRTMDFTGCLKDVAEALKYARMDKPGAPVFVAGESMGGAIALRVTAEYPELVDGLISAVPAGDRFHMASDSVKVALNLFTRPGKTMNVSGLIVDRSTLKEDLRDRWKHDPMARFNLKPTELIQFQHFCDANHKYARMITKRPVLVLQGAKDKLVKPESTSSVFHAIASEDRKLVVVEGSEHLMLEEGQFNDELINMLTTWIDKHLPASKS